MVELADTRDLKSLASACGFEPRHRHHVVADFVSFAAAFFRSVAPPSKIEPTSLGFNFAFKGHVHLSAVRTKHSYHVRAKSACPSFQNRNQCSGLRFCLFKKAAVTRLVIAALFTYYVAFKSLLPADHLRCCVYAQPDGQSGRLHQAFAAWRVPEPPGEDSLCEPQARHSTPSHDNFKQLVQKILSRPELLICHM